MTVIRKSLLFIVATFCFLVFVVLLRTFTLEVKQTDVKQCEKSDFDFIPATDEVIERFRNALRFQTVAREKHDYNRKELKQLGDFIKDGKLIMLSTQQCSAKNIVGCNLQTKCKPVYHGGVRGYLENIWTGVCLWNFEDTTYSYNFQTNKTHR